MWPWKIETIKSSLILPHVCLKHCFNLFHLEKAQVTQDEQLFSWILISSIVMLLRECHAWFHIGSIITQITAMSMQWKQSGISIKDKQTIISHLEKSEKGTNLALKFKVSKQQISDIRKKKRRSWNLPTVLRQA